MVSNLIQYYKESFQGLSKEVWSLALITLINRIGSMVITFLTIYLTQELGFTLIQAGYILAAHGLGSLLGNYLGGFLTDRYGFYFTQLSSLILSGICYILLFMITTFWFLFFFVTLTNTISEIFRPANMSSFACYSKPENLTRAC